MSSADFPLDFANLKLDPKPRRLLVLPADYRSSAKPNMISPVFECQSTDLLELFGAVAMSQPRVQLKAKNDTQCEFVQSSAFFRFPDVITAEVMGMENGNSALAVYSRAKVGHYDFKVNEKRVRSWIAMTQARLSG